MWLLTLILACGPPRGDTFGLSRADQPADHLVFNNQTEPEYLDPGLATGHPDSRIIGELFDGLTEYDPADLSPRPSHAGSWDAHPDGRGYTFHLRPDAVWSDGRPVLASDYAWSWERVLNPIFLSRYAQQLYAVQNAEAYNQGRIGLLDGTPVLLEESNVVRLLSDVEVEVGVLPEGALVVRQGQQGDRLVVSYRPSCPDLADQPALLACEGEEVSAAIPADAAEMAFPLLTQRVLAEATRLDDGTILGRGTTMFVLRADGDRRQVLAGQRFGWVPAAVLAHPRGEIVRYRATPAPPIAWPGDPPDDRGAGVPPALPGDVSAADLVVSPEILGFRAVDDHTLVVRLGQVAPYFLQQTSHTTLRAVPRWAIEAHGDRWTHPDRIVTSGAYLLDEHEIRDKFELVANPDWWGAGEPEFARMPRRVTAFSIDNLHVSANLYRAGYTDLVVANDLPPEFVPILRDKDDFEITPALSAYLYRLNTDRPPLDDVRVRRALAMAVDKEEVVQVVKAGEIPASSIVPPGIPGYEQPSGPPFDPEAARALLAEAGFPGGEGFPELQVLYNTQERHKLVAAVIQAQWQRHLGIEVRLQNREWKTYLKSVNEQDYDVVRGGWIGDYVDPNTFLNLWVTEGGNNNTGWSNARYDALLDEASREPDPEIRMALLAEAESILNEEMPFIPLYWYVWSTLEQPSVRGNEPNLIDQHPIRYMWLDR